MLNLGSVWIVVVSEASFGNATGMESQLRFVTLIANRLQKDNIVQTDPADDIW